MKRILSFLLLICCLFVCSLPVSSKSAVEKIQERARENGIELSDDSVTEDTTINSEKKISKKELDDFFADFQKYLDENYPPKTEPPAPTTESPVTITESTSDSSSSEERIFSMNNITLWLSALGGMFVLFTLGRLLNIFCLYREDMGRYGAVDSALSVISGFLMIFGFAASAVYFFFAQFDSKRAERRGQDKQKKLDDMMLPGERKDAYSKGYEAGYRDGKISAGFPEKTKKTPEP